MTEKTTVPLRDGDPGELIATVDGTDRTYYRHMWGVNWVCTELQVRRGFVRRPEGAKEPAQLTYWIDGEAWLANDDSLSVLGTKNRTTKVEVQLRVDDRENLLERTEHDMQVNDSEVFGRAWLGFNQGDWELRSKDQWFLCVYLHSSAMQPIIDGILSGAVKGMHLRVKLAELYSDHAPYMPLDDVDLFLRPSRRDGDANMPEMAHGFLEGLSLDYGKFDVRSPPEVEPVVEEPVVQVQEPVVDHMLLAVQALGARIDALRTTLKWAVGFLVVCMLLLAAK